MKKSLKTVITTVVVVGFALLLVGCGKSGGYTAKVGETLNAKGKNINVSVKALSSLSKYQITDESLLYRGDTYGKLQLEIENKGSEKLDNYSLVVLISLVDDNKKELATSEPFITVEDNIYNNPIEAGGKTSGYVYFSEPNDDYDNPEKISDTTIANAKYLKVSVISGGEEKNGKLNIDYADYYLELK